MIYFFLIFSFIAFFAEIIAINVIVTEKNLTKVTITEHKVVPLNYNFVNNTLDNMEIKLKINNNSLVKIRLNSVKGLFFNKRTKIWRLVKNSVNTDKMHYVLEKNIMDQLNIKFYHDTKTLSSVISIRDKNEKEMFQGIIDSDKILQPLSNLVKYQKDTLLFNYETNNSTNDNQHIVYKLNLYKSLGKNITENQRTKSNLIDVKNKNIKQGMRKSKLGFPDIVYPEILIILDKQLFSIFEYNVEKTLYYVLSYWNAVDLLFRRMDYPKVRLNIGGIIIAEAKLPFIDNKFLADKTLNDFSHFLFNQDEIKFRKDYDAAMLMTGSIIKNPNNNKIKGKAYVGVACWENVLRKQIFATSIVTHKKLYNSIISTVHELAHLFGVPHDGFATELYLGGPGGKECFFEEGFIMSHKRHNKNQFQFSKCSMKSMSFFFSRKNAECLRNKPGTTNKFTIL
ncbi:venom metalloproteinase 2-like [Leptopilina heterotoma]|uniref:venom metalloproteinase 2-like n=1 Tax=Leptopilina heterotoma TaxID=63436 RepID=UPI001CA84419|nr:venom metalloproteinase 2-like [Leptopilina heterotoma]XP_043482582.1 venom metalloproteinase 2-like [Leptopilina heterotoma]XP_043482583.1 venom metalloproteinase 2-like [Leptopilina heterotoma]